METDQAEHELQYIKQVMMESRRSLVDNGIGYIIWGVIIPLALMLNYLDNLDLIEVNSLYIWITAVGLGWILTFILIKKERKDSNTRSLGSRILNVTWAGAGSAMTLIGFVGTMTGVIPGAAVCPLFSIILGMTYLVCAVAYNLKWLTYLALLWWAGAIVMFYWQSVHMLLLMALMMIGLQLIPGIILYLKWKKEYQKN